MTAFMAINLQLEMTLQACMACGVPAMGGERRDGADCKDEWGKAINENSDYQCCLRYWKHGAHLY